MKKTVQRQRKRDNLAANPDLALACDRSLLLLQIPPTLLSAWKVFDSGPSSTRVIILTTEPNLDFLCQSMRCCVDGTFKAAPELFTQLYTIHGMKSGYTVPCVYALLPNKRKVKSWLDVAGRQWSFESFLSDYEQGAYNAVLDVFPGIGEEGCFFHLFKRLDFPVKRLGLMTKYLTDDDFKLRMKMLSALAFVLVSDVVANFESLATTFLNDELPLLGYFKSTWIGQSVGGRRLPPMFSHHMWNVLDRAGTGSTRTTNALESFHHSFNSLLSCTHPADISVILNYCQLRDIIRKNMLNTCSGFTVKLSVVKTTVTMLALYLQNLNKIVISVCQFLESLLYILINISKGYLIFLLNQLMFKIATLMYNTRYNKIMKIFRHIFELKSKYGYKRTNIV